MTNASALSEKKPPLEGLCFDEPSLVLVDSKSDKSNKAKSKITGCLIMERSKVNGSEG